MPPGRKDGELPALRIRTGLLDDRRAPIREGDRRYPLAYELCQRFEAWNGTRLDEHGDAFTDALAWWPFARGAPTVSDHQSRALARLATAGVPPEERAAILRLAPDSVRHRADRTGHRRDRPSAERGIELEGWADDDLQGFALRLQIGTLEIGRPPLPRVYRDCDPEPDLTYFNPRVRLLQHAPGAWPRRSDAPIFLHRAAQEELRRLRLRVHGA